MEKDVVHIKYNMATMYIGIILPYTSIMVVYSNLSSSEIAALRYILNHGSSTGYNIMKRPGNPDGVLSTKTCYKTLRTLTKRGLLSMNVIDQTRAGQDKKEYSLNLFGLCFAIADLRIADLDITSIREHWHNLIPRVFEKWDHFIKQQVEEEARIRLRMVCGWMTLPSLFMAFGGSIKDFMRLDLADHSQDDEEYLTRKFYMSDAEDLMSLDDSDFNAEFTRYVKSKRMKVSWEFACIADDDLYHYFKKQLNQFIEGSKEQMEILKLRLEVIESRRKVL